MELLVLLSVTLLFVAFLSGIVVGENLLLASLQPTGGNKHLGLQALRTYFNAFVAQGASGAPSTPHSDQPGSAPPSTPSQQDQQRHAPVQHQGSLSQQHTMSDADKAISRQSRQRAMLSHPVHEWYISDDDFQYFQVSCSLPCDVCAVCRSRSGVIDAADHQTSWKVSYSKLYPHF